MAAHEFVPSSIVGNVTITDTSYVAFAAVYASKCTIINNTDEDINVRVDLSTTSLGTPMLVLAGTFYQKDGITNMNQVKVARAAGSGSLTVQAEVE